MKTKPNSEKGKSDKHPAAAHFHVFLSHNSRDKASVEPLAFKLKERGLNPFLDKWNLVPGMPIEDALVDALEESDSAVIFVGPTGEGPWQSEEMRDILRRAVKSQNEFRAIPVLLPGSSPNVLESSFLGSRLWIEFADIDDENALLRLAKAIRGEAYHSESFELPDEPAPYPGLERFERIDKQDEDFFFGRDDEIRILVDRLVRDRFVSVVGASGSGKSSLVRAGLTKQLANDRHPGIQRWEMITVEPGDSPFRSLAVQVAVHAGIPVQYREDWIERMVREWSEAPEALRKSFESIFADKKEPVLLFIDQFEEIFTHRRDDTGGFALARAFVGSLEDLWRNGGDQVRVVTALRADFVERCLEIGPLKEMLQDRTMLIGEVGDDALREIVKEPAARVGAFLEKGLMERILTEVRTQSGSLPLLQQALHQLWRHRKGAWFTHDAYDASGGVASALNDQAQRSYSSLSDKEKRIADMLFPRLITLGEGMSDTRRRVRRNELYPEGIESREVDQVINKLSDKTARILVTSREGDSEDDLGNGEDFVEFTHEALLGNWEHLVHLLDSERESIRKHRALTSAAREWDAKTGKERSKFLLRAGQLVISEQWANAEGGYDRLNQLERQFLNESLQEREAEEARKAKTARRLKTLTAGSVVAAVIAVGIGIVAFMLKLEADKSADKAKQSAVLASERKEEAEKQTEFANKKKLEAEQAEKVALAAKEETIQEVIHNTWKVGRIIPVPQVGGDGEIRLFYEELEGFIDLEKLQSLFPGGVFLEGGPHETHFNFQSHDFGRYNPEFIKWAEARLIPGAEDAQFRAATQVVYNNFARDMARTFYLVYLDLQESPDLVSAVKKEYVDRIERYKDRPKVEDFDPNTPSFYIIPVFSNYAVSVAHLMSGLNIEPESERKGFSARIAPGFWIRREIDGTSQQVFKVLAKLLQTYDKEFLAALGPPKSPDERVKNELSGRWTPEGVEGPDIIFQKNGIFLGVLGTKISTSKWALGPFQQNDSTLTIDGESLKYSFWYGEGKPSLSIERFGSQMRYHKVR